MAWYDIKQFNWLHALTAEVVDKKGPQVALELKGGLADFGHGIAVDLQVVHL